MHRKTKITSKAISRLSLYRRLLINRTSERADRVFSRELARNAGVSAAQVRRDIMALGYSGTPNSGYDIQALIDHISEQIDAPEGQQVALVGVGNLGQALLSYFSSGQRARLRIAAAFDISSKKTGQILSGCRCYRTEKMVEVIRRDQITLGIIAVPAEAAQETAYQLAMGGVTGILNFAPVPVKVPPDVYIENMNITIRLETVAFFARGQSQ